MTDVRPSTPASGASPDPDPGPLPDRLGERFELGELLGRGTCSEVYRAHDLLLDREAAVKIFPVTDDPRIEREVRLTASMDHPSLVPVYDVGHDAGRAFVVMALLEGGSLADRLAGGPLGVRETLLAVASVADGLSHVHRAGVLHRDVTPRNVLFDGDGRAHLSDFGVAFVADAPRITDTGIVVGSAPYLAPEQVRGESVGAPADVYALGLVMIEALTARPAYEGAPLAAARARLERRPDMPPGLEIEVLALLEAMTADDPAHRPTAENVCLGLRRAALAAEAPTPPYAMAPVAGAGTPDATTENLRPVAAATTALGAVAGPASGETPGLAEVPERRRRRLADAGGFMVAASVAAAVLLAGGVVVASAWTVDRVNTATPPAATVPPPTAEVVADPGGGSSGGGGHSSSSRDEDDGDGDDGGQRRATDDGSERQAAALVREPSTAAVTDGGSASTTTRQPSSTTTPSPTTTAPTSTTPTSTTPTSTTTSETPSSTRPTSTTQRPALVPGLPTVTVPGLPHGTATITPSTPQQTTQQTTQPTTTSAPGSTTEATSEAGETTETTESATHSATSHTASSSAAADRTTTTTTTAPKKKTVLDPAVEALGGLIR
ncbi:serine/threonine-protein kinase [Actinomycetospora succinea]|nr:serine/threonine-protein kinase [Actinomycetospora succinea]